MSDPMICVPPTPDEMEEVAQLFQLANPSAPLADIRRWTSRVVELGSDGFLRIMLGNANKVAAGISAVRNPWGGVTALDLAVYPEYRHLGYASHLMASVEAWASDYIELEVSEPCSAAIPIYLGRGYKIVGTKLNLEGVLTILMRRDLHHGQSCKA